MTDRDDYARRRPRIRVIVAGGSGLIGTALVAALLHRGDSVVRLVRRPPREEGERQWDPSSGSMDPAVLGGADVVVSLGGASVGRLPWTRSYKRRLVSSRIVTTRALATAVRALGRDAPRLLSASASGFYGDAPGVVLNESSPAGSTFLARLCAAWEREALSAGPAARVALLRTGSVVHPTGVLRPLLPLTRLGLAGPIGGGAQIWPWVSLPDEVAGILHVMDSGIAGPVNLVAPAAATATEFVRTVARELRRPFALPAPRFALRALLGRDAADSLLLSDARVAPQVLLDSGFAFTLPRIDAAVADALSR